MAILRISEYGVVGWSQPVAVRCPAVVVQPFIDFTDGQVHTSQPFSDHTKAIRVSTDTVALFKVGPNAVATVNDDILPAKSWEYLWVNQGDVLSVVHG